jgi:3-oxoacyl-[acyl-carrier protein] reductase
MPHAADTRGLDGRVAIVTGAARGIGRAISVEFARAGCAVAAVDIVEPSETVAAVVTNGGRGHPVVADVTDAVDVARAVQRALEQFGQVDILVNNAGVAEREALLDLTDDMFKRLVGVNLLGYIHFIQAIYPHMRDRGEGRIVNVSSISAKNGGTSVRAHGGARRSGIAYAATKGGINSITWWVARELGPEGIRCNAVCPGPTESELTAGVDYGVDDQPIPRMGRGEDVAAAVVWLASDAASFVTGQTMNVDGGRVME